MLERSLIEVTKMIRTLLFTLAIAAFASATATCGGKSATIATIAPPVAIPQITTARASRASLGDTYEATGTVTAKTTTQVSANILGRINSMQVSEGDTVKKGQPLVGLDEREARTQLDKAEAGLREAQASLVELEASVDAASAAVKTSEAGKRLADVTLARYRELYAHRSVSGQELDEALSRASSAASELERMKANAQTTLSKKAQINARISQAKADIANAKINASYTHILSPVSGVIVKKFAEAGAIASPGMPLISIEENSQFTLEATIGESHLALVHIGDRVDVRVDALGTTEVGGTVAEMLPTSDAASRSYKVKILLPPHPLLRSGLFGVARFTLAGTEAIAIPETAIIQRGQLTGVYIVEHDGTARFRIVTTGRTFDEMVEVLSGLNEGDEVVSTGTGNLKDGTKVR